MNGKKKKKKHYPNKRHGGLFSLLLGARRQKQNPLIVFMEWWWSGSTHLQRQRSPTTALLSISQAWHPATIKEPKPSFVTGTRKICQRPTAKHDKYVDVMPQRTPDSRSVPEEQHGIVKLVLRLIPMVVNGARAKDSDICPRYRVNLGTSALLSNPWRLMLFQAKRWPEDGTAHYNKLDIWEDRHANISGFHSNRG